MKNEALVNELNRHFATDLPGSTRLEELQKLLAAHINQLIQTNFQQLITLLYRIDVSESKLKKLLQQYPTEDAGKMIAALIIERQLQKIKSRQQFNQRDDNFSEDEKW